MSTDVALRIGGQAGQGMQSIGRFFKPDGYVLLKWKQKKKFHL